MKVRTWMDYNLTPIPGPNPLWGEPDQPQWIPQFPCFEALDKLGFRKAFMVYDGTVGRSSWWSYEQDGRVMFRPGSENHHAELGTPEDRVTDFGVKACARLAAEGGRYHGGDNYVPVIFDFEGPFWAQDFDPEIVARQYARMAKCCKIVKDETNWRCRVGAYGWPGMVPDITEPTKAMLDFGAQADYAAPCFYNVPSWAPDHNWFNFVDQYTNWADRFFPHLRRIAVVHPAYTVWWIDSHPELAHLDGEPIAVGVWSRQMQFLAERNYEIFPWTGYLLPTPKIVRLLAEVQKYALK